MYAELSEVYPETYGTTVPSSPKQASGCDHFIDHYFSCENCQFNFIINRHDRYNFKNNLKDIVIIILLILLLTLK